MRACCAAQRLAWHARNNGSSMQVLKGNDNKAVHVQILFSTVFMISCSMFSLVLFEGGRILTQTLAHALASSRT
jgi:hypothetical protein